MKCRIYVLVSGKVQGVFFRSSAKKRADELHLTGWVRNLDDGRVEAVFEGEQEKVDKMVEWCRKGPDYADVKDVRVISEKYRGELKGFSIIKSEDCGEVHTERKDRKVPVRVIVSSGEKSFRIWTLLSGVIRVGDELVMDDETSGEAYPVQISSIEVGDKRKESAKADEIKTIWVRAIDEVVVKIAVSHRETTESIEMKAPGDREFIIGEKIKVDNRELKIIRIKIRDGGFKSRKGVAIKASDIKRIYAESGQREQRRLSKGGERIVIKKRESVWSLKTKKTD